MSKEASDDKMEKNSQGDAYMIRKTLIPVMIAAVMILFCVCSGACAELKKGSEGDEVREMQQMLIDLGVLKDKADGAFGKKTENAVRKMQKYWGTEQNGVADDVFLLQLNDLWHLALGNGTESGLDPETDLEDPVKSCGHNESAPYGYDYCYRHDEGKALRDLLNPGKGRTIPDGLKRVVLTRLKELWLEYNRSLYAEWEEILSEEDKHIAQEQLQIFEDAWARNEKSLARQGGGADTLKTLEKQVDWLENMGIEECFDLHGAEPNTDEVYSS